MASSRVRDVVNAAIDGLRANGALTTALGSAKVYTHVPENTSPPYCWVFGGDEIPWAITLDDGDSGDSGGRQVDVLVNCVSRYRGTSQVDELASLAMIVLTTSSTWSGVSDFQLAEFVRNQMQAPTEVEGEMWFVRTVTVRVTVG